MGKYCCFFDPKKDYTDKELSDKCEICGRRYDYVLENSPAIINNGTNEYKIIKSIGRGFYSATYLCEIKKRFRIEKVLLKVIPISVYKFFNKNFEEECTKHAEVSNKTEHLVKINDAFETLVNFGDENIDCHVAELQYINGDVLGDYISKPENVQPKIFAQLSIDLLRLWHELFLKNEFHNDLHMGNLIVEELENSIQRVDGIYDKIRLVAIDLNSVSNESFSDADAQRLGDKQYIAKHIAKMSFILRSKYDNIDKFTDTDFRLIETLNKISNLLSINSSLMDIPNVTELINMIKNEFENNVSYSPWKQSLFLSRINDSINAQILHSCHVPKLLVDPEGKWLNEISKSGPQLITGMRGCGKTMLLRALDVHARFEVNKEIICREETLINYKDHYVGITASCRDLIDIDDICECGISKLILLYAVQIIKAIRHLKDINNSLIRKDYYQSLAKLIEDIFGLKIPTDYLYSDTLLERFLIDKSNHINEFCTLNDLRVNSIIAFEMLADVFIASSSILQGKQVYYLLDDASTRYLSIEKISKLLTKVLFMSNKCAFKITTEMQTLYGFKSPGNVEMAHDIRDYQIFDLGADVFNNTRDPKTGKKFIQSIIGKRMEVCNGLVQIPPSIEEVLGDAPLSSIAKYIIDHPSGKDRKEVYHGASALTALCVGDIGDIIYLYDAIISSNNTNRFPVSKKIQHQSYQQLCSRRMYNLERKDGELREYVKAFSEASYKCLMDSYKAIKKDGKKSERIRQYNGLYIRITSGDISRQQERVRKLIDSGIFVFADGNGWPRSRSNDTDPITQIKLAFRKLFGVSNFIGLASADRFELSGEILENWLEHPSKDVLLRNLGKYDDAQETFEEPGQNITIKRKIKEVTGVGQGYQMSLFDLSKTNEVFDEVAATSFSDTLSVYNEELLVNRVDILKKESSILKRHFEVAIFGLGFEERTLESVRRVTEKNTIDNIILISYTETGYSKEIIDIVNKIDPNFIIINYTDIDKILQVLKNFNEILLDITGLYKPIIFEGVRYSIINSKNLTIVHTLAKQYYPLDSDIDGLLGKNKSDIASKFVKLMKGLDTGDVDAYNSIKLLPDSNYDPVRPTVLIGFVSPKNQRIFSLLDKAEYDSTVLFLPNGNSSRDLLSNAAGNIAKTNYASVNLKVFDTRNLRDVLNAFAKEYFNYYVNNNYNIEFALTGSKMQAVATAAFSSFNKISQCWYVKPDKFDSLHFTKGVGETEYYTIKFPK